MIFRPEQAIVDSQRLAHAVAAALEAGDHVVIVPVAAIGRAECDLHRQRAVRRRAPMPSGREIAFGEHVAVEPVALLRFRSEEHTSDPVTNAHLVCRLLLEKTKKEESYYIYF